MEELEDWQKEFEYCIYAKRLLDKVIYLNSIVKVPKVDVLAVKKAIYYARKYHGSQMRQSGEPFYSHPIEVAYMLSDYLFRTDVIATSILHDTIEDTELTKEKVAEEFGWKVANQVMDLTRLKENGIKISSAEMVEILYQEKKHDVLLIKLFDRLHNMQTIGAKSPEKAKKTVEETISRFLSLSFYFKVPGIVQILLEIQMNTIQEKYDCNQYHDRFQPLFQVSQSTIPPVHILLS
ncbi:HD domain-containing protein [Rickettsia conorii]|uniref:Guanosine polyphosphate pyrophosphohydrolase n=1 Tax=Rickettsia conorii subsp. raoultii TaxID=369822 RepID=A0A9N7BD44_RICCR|nr:HD domain-containing protein [Rickettsia conorii]AJQ51848.1 guanosine polyphosphate pyrophosphohydrolase [Rickettsia conorii subsp. raoultii]APZ30071.1 guanosine polyphosphate pyrophosphohydrolase [Rickettsia conorii subsp. raoultii]URW77693.1 HD domain-containing protein [Rickettsia conorii subsp. raoultii]